MERESIKVLNELDSMMMEINKLGLMGDDSLKICLKKLKDKYSGNGDNKEKV